MPRIMNIKTAIAKICFLLILSSTSHGQDQQRKLPPNINQPSVNLYAPAISGDGSTLVYLSDYTDDGSHSMYFTTKKSGLSWNEPIEVSKVINRPTLNYRGGYCLSFDGNMLVFTSRKSGLGGFELWYSERQGNNWGAPANFGRPINSASNEGTPSLSPDGESMFFMRCDGMTEEKGATGCKIFVTTKKYGKWQEPVELPANINTGNSQNPKILADGESLIFSSDKMGGKGGLDLFITRKEGDSWSKPIPMDFINTSKDDQFVSFPSRGRYLYASQHTGREYQLVEVLVPDEFQPKKVMKIEGKVVDKSTGQPVNAKLTAFNVNLRDRIWNDQIGEAGEFSLVLNEGSTYDLSVVHPDPSYMYYSKIYALETIGRRDRENLKIELTKLARGLEFDSDIFFKENSSEIDDRSTYELRRLSDMVRRNPSIQLQFTIEQTNYKSDSLRSDMDLTEIHIDSIYIDRQVSVETQDSNLDDLSEIDSVNVSSPEPVYETVRELITKTTYHNDRTVKQSDAIKNYLMEKGSTEENIRFKYKKSQSRVEDREDVIVKVKVLGL